MWYQELKRDPLEIPVYFQQYLIESEEFDFCSGYTYRFKFENGRELRVDTYPGVRKDFETLEIIGRLNYGERKGYLTNDDVIKEIERVRKL